MKIAGVVHASAQQIHLRIENPQAGAAACGADLAARLARARSAATVFTSTVDDFCGRCLTLAATARQANRMALNIRLKANAGQAEVFIGLLLDVFRHLSLSLSLYTSLDVELAAGSSGLGVSIRLIGQNRWSHDLYARNGVKCRTPRKIFFQPLLNK